MSPINQTLFALDDEPELHRANDPLLSPAAVSSPANQMAEQIIQVLAERLVTAERQKTLAEVARDEALVIQEWGQDRVAEIESEKNDAAGELLELRDAFEALRDEFQLMRIERDELRESNRILKNQSAKETKAIAMLWQDRSIQNDELDAISAERDEVQVRNKVTSSALKERSVQFDAMAAAVDSLAEELDETREKLRALERDHVELNNQRRLLNDIIADVENIAKTPLALPVRARLLEAVQTNVYIDPLAS